ELAMKHLLVDIGAASREEALARVQIGEAGVFVRPVVEAGEHRLIAKAADNRAGCAVLVEVLKGLKASPHRVVAVFAVQEEVGLRGAGRPPTGWTRTWPSPSMSPSRGTRLRPPRWPSSWGRGRRLRRWTGA